jgi:hypothetical protein
VLNAALHFVATGPREFCHYNSGVGSVRKGINIRTRRNGRSFDDNPPSFAAQSIQQNIHGFLLKIVGLHPRIRTWHDHVEPGRYGGALPGSSDRDGAGQHVGKTRD